RRAEPQAGEDAGVEIALRARRHAPVLARAPARGPPGPEPGTEGERHPARPPADAVGNLRPGHPHHVAPPQALDAARDVVLWVEGVRVHAHDVVAARVPQADVESGGGGPARVVEDP